MSLTMWFVAMRTSKPPLCDATVRVWWLATHVEMHFLKVLLPFRGFESVVPCPPPLEIAYGQQQAPAPSLALGVTWPIGNTRSYFKLYWKCCSFSATSVWCNPPPPRRGGTFTTLWGRFQGGRYICLRVV